MRLGHRNPITGTIINDWGMEIMTTANIITIVRILLIPAFMAAALINAPGADITALAIFALASLTDGLDGYIARKYRQVTTLGKFLDPLADKLLVTAAILIFVETGVMPAVAAMLIITREFAVTSLRIVAMGQGVVVAAKMAGKIKTVVQILAVIFLFTPLAGFSVFQTGASWGDVAVWLMTIVTVVSGAAYFKGFGKLLKAKGNDHEAL